MVGGRLKGFTSPPGWTLAPLRSASGGGGPLTRPPPTEGSYAEPSMAALSHTIRLQQLSWQTLEDLAFCSRTPRLAEVAAQLLFERQLQAPAATDPRLAALLPF